MIPPRSAFGAPPWGGDAGGPAKPDPRRPLDGATRDRAVAAGARVWLFDLDNTLHDASHAIFRQIDRRMTDYVERHL